jgi:hypothetical protein
MLAEKWVHSFQGSTEAGTTVKYELNWNGWNDN